jgi:TolA-binding protein
MNSLLCATALALLLILPACNLEQNRANQNSTNAIESARQEKQAYEAKIDQALRDLDQEIEALKIKVRVQNRADRPQIDQQIDQLERKRAELRARLMKLKESSGEAWKDMKGGSDRALADLDVVYEQAVSHFK